VTWAQLKVMSRILPMRFEARYQPNRGHHAGLAGRKESQTNLVELCYDALNEMKKVIIQQDLTS
jgi:hypothetical protein